MDSRHAGQPCPRPQAALGFADAMMLASAGGRLFADATAAALRAAGTSVRLTRLIEQRRRKDVPNAIARFGPCRPAG